MKKIRIGNDILIRWSITRNGEAEDFTGLSTLRVSVLDEIGARQKVEYSVSDNTITIQYRGANQKKNGVYSLLLEENRGVDGMVTLDHIEAFELVPHSAYAGGKTCSNIGIETVELSSDIDVAQGSILKQAQSDWNQNDDTQPDYIKNKPTIPDVSGLATKTELNQGLSTKQNVIEDLDEIRDGAEYGKTSVQPEDLTPYRTASDQDIIDSGKQPKIVDLNTIRQGAAAGATAVQPSELSSFDTSVQVTGKIASHNIDQNSHQDLRNRLEGVENIIPNEATVGNKLADKDFVNSSLNSITAFYITKDVQGNQFDTKAQLDSTTTFYSGGEVRIPTRNDYCIVLADETKADSTTGENPTTRYVYQNNRWEFQYVVNKTTLTAAQLAAINSGITSGKVTQYDEYATGKQDTINDIETIRSGAESGATAYQKPSTGIPATDLAAGVIPDITYDLAFLSLADNTTSFNFPANQQCHRKVRIVASATLNFAVENKACNYVRVYNSGASEITLTIGTVTHNGTSVSLKVGPAEIKCGVGKYVEISVIYDGSEATFTASEDLQVLN